ncbi:hypothetical protein LHJ74_03555 [Streptomyces sp. N2-109]|uniref:Secreted protein n=1 Tax=Streptomyces gossypii TaxID=2883101 RepID=A0ABT2JMB3_9ACTN|nr:hypothetical protein [Streptomyces gossypii]MCT2589019.1 hypothetical protein [Streptomyces gossypii]
MAHAIARLFVPLLRLLLPPAGQHRCPAEPPPAALPFAPPTAPRPLMPAPVLLRGEDSALVRPYVLTPEERQEARQQQVRRRVLWLAVHGVDAGPRWIHGMEVTA